MAALAAGTLLAYSGAVRNAFVNLDDKLYVTENPHVAKGLSREGIIYAFTTFDSGNWIPLTWLSLELDASLYGVNAHGFHATNVALHTINVLLLFSLLQCLTGSFWRSLIAAALFAVHPLHVESVAWVSERKDLLSLFWLLICVLAYRSYSLRPGAGRYAAVVIPFGLGLLSKSMLVTLPVLLLLLDVWPLGRTRFLRSPAQASSGAREQNLKWLMLEKIPLLCLSLVIGLITIAAQQGEGATQALSGIPLWVRIGNALNACVWYVEKTFWPTGLCVMYSHPLQNVSWGQVAVSSGVLVGISLLCVIRGRQAPWLSMGWLWFLISLLPVSGLFQVGVQAHADRYSYIPQIGLLVMIVWEAHFWFSRVRWGVRAGIPITVLSAAALTGVTLRQVGYWKNSETLWQRAISVDPEDWFANFQMASLLVKQQKLDAARGHLLRTVRQRPDYDAALANLGSISHQMGDLDAAEKYYLQALKRNPCEFSALKNMASLKSQQGDPPAALRYLQSWVECYPHSSETRNQLGLAYARRGLFELALPEFLAATQISPRDADARLNAGRVLVDLNRPAEAIHFFNQALEINPESAAAHLQLAGLLERESRTAEALAHYAAALALNPQDAQAAAGCARLGGFPPRQP